MIFTRSLSEQKLGLNETTKHHPYELLNFAEPGFPVAKGTLAFQKT
jgi:hypothetical protein